MTQNDGSPMSLIRPTAPTLLMPQGMGRRSLVAGTAALLAVPLAAPPAARAQQAPAVPTGPSAAIDVDRARVAPIPIAIPALSGSGGDTDRLGRDIAVVITNNLGRSGLFRPIDPAAYINSPPVGDTPNFQNWKAIGAQALVTGRVESQGGDKLRVEFRLWDVLPRPADPGHRLHHHAIQLAPHRPHHQRRDL